MSPRLVRSPVVRRGALAVAALALLSGCGHTPGAAIQVGDTVVTRDTVNQFVDAQCTLTADAVKGGQAQSGARAQAVWQIVGVLLDATVVNAYADSHGTTYPAADLRTQTARIDQVTASLPKTKRDEIRSSLDSVVKGNLQAISIGKEAIEKQGSSAQPTDEQAYSVGYNIARAWAEKQGIKVDPRYNLGTKDDAGAGDGSVSRPTSTFAKNAAKGANAQDYLASIGPDQRCG